MCFSFFLGWKLGVLTWKQFWMDFCYFVTFFCNCLTAYRGVDVLCSALERFAASEEVTEPALCALRHCTARHSMAPQAQSDAHLAQTQRVILDLLSSMRAPVVKAALGLVRNLALLPSNLQSLAHVRIFDFVWLSNFLVVCGNLRHFFLNEGLSFCFFFYVKKKFSKIFNGWIWFSVECISICLYRKQRRKGNLLFHWQWTC